MRLAGCALFGLTVVALSLNGVKGSHANENPYSSGKYCLFVSLVVQPSHEARTVRPVFLTKMSLQSPDVQCMIPQDPMGD